MSHVLFISHARGIHGAEAVMVQAVKACATKGVWVTVVVPSIVPDQGLEAALSGLFGIQILPLKYRPAGGSRLRTDFVLFYNIRAARELADYIKRNNITTVYSCTSITILGALVTKATGVRHVWHFHEPVDKRFGWHKSLTGYYRSFAHDAGTIICISRKQQQEWEEALQMPFTNAQIIYNPIKRIEVKHKQPHEGISLGFIGHFEPRKNIELLVHTFEKLHAKYPNTTLLLCGAMNKKDRQYIKKMTHMQEPDIHILQQTSDVASFYSSIDILVLPSWKETMPLVILEAMQAGVCVLQTNQSGMNELLENNKETLFFAPDQSDTLLHMLEQCMDSDYRQSIAMSGQQKALQLVNKTSFDEQITNLLCEL